MKRNPMPKKFSVTVGIPAFNEEENIANLLNSLLKQSQKVYNLEKIIVVSDGSNDNTETIVANLAKKNPIITLITDKKRIGKAQRLMKLYKVNKSDFILQIDADIIPGTNRVIDNLMKNFVNEKIAVVSGNAQPVQPITYVGYLFYVWFKLWYDFKKTVKDPNIIHNIRSQMIVSRKDFAKKFKLIPRLSSDGQYIFCLTKQQKLSFRYADDAVFYFRLPTNIHDYLLQMKRTVDEKQRLATFFGIWIYDLFKIPFASKLRVLLKHLLTHPVDTFLASSLFLILRFMPQTRTQKMQSGKWKTVESTKKAITFNSV